MKTDYQIKEIMTKVTNLLLVKNASYGDSATKPCNIFAKGSAIENICARIDDKLARIKNKGLDESTYDTIDDLMGYLCLLKIAIAEDALSGAELELKELNGRILKESKTK
jgi:hypothetical protein